ncbi:MAG: hypothetical protein GY694_17745 [Gammaproteobacteria bacterium]|nr:hypothetical protein [Gammaproteobacteria bacterium]
MENQISISMEFFFKGIKYSPSMVIDLNTYTHTSGDETLYTLLANNNDIGLYSYEYEMMQAEQLVFSDAKGLAKLFLKDGKFDFIGFNQAQNDKVISNILSSIANKHLSINDLSQEPNIQSALLEAYKQGQNQNK